MDELVRHIESFDDWVQYFTDIKEQEAIDMWMWADATLEYSRFMGGSLRQLASSGIGKSQKTLESYRYTALVFPEDRRVLDIGFSIHRICAYTDDPQMWLDLVKENDWSSSKLKKEIRISRGEKDEAPCPYLSIYCGKQKKVLLEPKAECERCPYKNDAGDYTG